MRLETHKNGAIAELKAQTTFTELGYAISVPITEERYDFILDTGSKLLRIQVKSGYFKEASRDGVMTCDLCAGVDNKPYDDGEIDAFVIYNPNDDELYWMDYDGAPKYGTERLVSTWREDIVTEDFIV